MPKSKRSFFEKLTGAINVEDDELFEDELEIKRTDTNPDDSRFAEENERVAELAVDVYQAGDDIVVQTIIAGVDPQELDITITREMVTIAGRRERTSETVGDDYFHQELYWGAFSRNILLPEEVDVDEARATEKNGLLTIHLPRIDKKRKTKLEVHSLHE